MLVDETANATIAPRPTPSNQSSHVSIHDFYVAHACVHEGALCKTAKQMGATLQEELHKYKGYSMAKEIRVSIPYRTDNRADKKLSHVRVDLRRRSMCPMIVRYNVWCYA